MAKVAAEPALAGPTASDTITTVVLQNAGAGPLAAGVATFGQVFAQGELPAGGGLLAAIGGAAVAVQVDVKTTYADGSAKTAVVSVARPDLAAGQAAEVALSAGPPPAAGAAIDLARALEGHSCAVELAPADGGAAFAVDALAALRAALADGTASWWQRGELAAQARVEVDVPGAASSMRLVFDVTAFRGGGVEVDARFANDRAMEAAGGRAAYRVTADLDGHRVLDEAVDQGQYQSWHRALSTTAADGGQGAGDPAGGWLNVVHDAAALGRLGAVPDLDPGLAIPEGALAGYAAALAAPGWGDPLAANGVVQYMPQTGGRPDIGPTTAPNAAWLLTGDARAAAYAMGQAEAAGAVPWNFWDAATGSWVGTDQYPRLWTAPPGGVDPQTTGLTQPVPQDTGWTADNAHQPDLSYVPYLLTGERWVLDGLQAQAAFNIVGFYPVPRGFAQDLVVDGNQVRGAAWGLREIDEAAWASPDGSPEKAYFQAASDANWAWLVSKLPEWTAQQGEAHGWIPGDYREPGATAPWQQDYFATTALAAAERGNADALKVVEWEKNFLIGRFGHTADGLNPHDGVAYSLAVMDPATGTPYRTWAEVGAATVARGLSNGDGWGDSDYGQLALGTLAGVWRLTGDEAAAEAYRWLAASGAPHLDDAARAVEPQFAVAPPGSEGGPGGDHGGPVEVLEGTHRADVLRVDGAGPGGAAVRPGRGADVIEIGPREPGDGGVHVVWERGEADGDVVRGFDPAAGDVLDLVGFKRAELAELGGGRFQAGQAVFTLEGVEHLPDAAVAFHPAGWQPDALLL